MVAIPYGVQQRSRAQRSSTAHLCNKSISEFNTENFSTDTSSDISQSSATNALRVSAGAEVEVEAEDDAEADAEVEVEVEAEVDV